MCCDDNSSSVLFGDFGAKFLRGIGQALKCSICLQYLNNPQFADCSHYFCASCIAKLVNSLSKPKKDKNTWLCPLCKAPVKRRALKKDPTAKQLVESFLELADAFEKLHQAEAILTQDPGTCDFSLSYLLPNHQLSIPEQANTDSILDGPGFSESHISLSEANNYADEFVSPSKALEKQIFPSSVRQ
ncbi:hypothetical protein DSO57_1028942 [Entomophthora muscae]|uniref:Uncharacterized protein n=1 Tax=Entomophthora muscae TaxID=34485 RepID=A0ACC2ULR4_9FUNG|nr:hypothetical protein DSO57_1028942 [Entomophthora muscae]